MAWIESHQSLLHHKKTNRAIALLKCDRHKFIGHLHALWWWALDNAPDGEVGDLQAAELADAAGWPVRKADAFLSALLAVGFLEEDEAGRRLHDWSDYAGRWNNLRASRAEAGRASGRTRAQKAKEQKGGLFEQTANTRSTPTDRPTDRPNQPTAPTDLPTSAGAREKPRPPLLRIAEQSFGRMLTPMEIESLKALEEEQPYERIEYAFRVAADNKARKMRYVQAVCEGEERNGDNHERPGQARGVEADSRAPTVESELARYGPVPEFRLDP